MSTKYTPGPLFARQESAGTFTVEKADGELRSILCRIHVEHLCEEHGGTIEGNAMLFASAPALLEALKAIGEIAENCLHGAAPLVATQTFASPIRNIRRIAFIAFEALALAEGGK